MKKLMALLLAMTMLTSGCSFIARPRWLGVAADVTLAGTAATYAVARHNGVAKAPGLFIVDFWLGVATVALGAVAVGSALTHSTPKPTPKRASQRPK